MDKQKTTMWYRSVRSYKYQTTKPMSIKLSKDYGVWGETNFVCIDHDTLYIQKGYAWDGASGPTWDTESSQRASLVHDALYQLIRVGILSMNDRISADKELERIAVEDGMWKWRAKMWRVGLKWFGASAAEPGGNEDAGR